MRKYIIELGEDANMVQVISVTQSGNAYIDSSVYVGYLEQLTADYINEHFGQLQDEAYQRGLSDGKKAFDLLESERNSEYQRGLSEGNDIGYKDGVKDGQNEAWECAKKLFSTMAESDIEKAFPIEWNSGGFKALMNLQPHEAIERLKSYEDDKIKRGDIVNVKGSCNDDL